MNSCRANNVRNKGFKRAILKKTDKIISKIFLPYLASQRFKKIKVNYFNNKDKHKINFKNYKKIVKILRIRINNLNLN